MTEKITLSKYTRHKHVRSSKPMVRVNRGYISFNRHLKELLDCDRVDLYVDRKARSVMIKSGADFKLTRTTAGRVTFSAAPFINDLEIGDGFFPARPHEGGFLFVY